jgi:hypothetical protein
MINRSSDSSVAGLTGSDAEEINADVYQSTKKWEWSFLRVSLMCCDVESLMRMCRDQLNGDGTFDGYYADLCRDFERETETIFRFLCAGVHWRQEF